VKASIWAIHGDTAACRKNKRGGHTGKLCGPTWPAGFRRHLLIFGDYLLKRTSPYAWISSEIRDCAKSSFHVRMISETSISRGRCFPSILVHWFVAKEIKCNELASFKWATYSSDRLYVKPRGWGRLSSLGLNRQPYSRLSEGTL